jgi:hypothetical protein
VSVHIIISNEADSTAGEAIVVETAYGTPDQTIVAPGATYECWANDDHRITVYKQATDGEQTVLAP